MRSVRSTRRPADGSPIIQRVVPTVDSLSLLSSSVAPTMKHPEHFIGKNTDVVTPDLLNVAMPTDQRVPSKEAISTSGRGQQKKVLLAAAVCVGDAPLTSSSEIRSQSIFLPGV